MNLDKKKKTTTTTDIDLELSCFRRTKEVDIKVMQDAEAIRSKMCLFPKNKKHVCFLKQKESIRVFESTRNKGFGIH